MRISPVLGTMVSCTVLVLALAGCERTSQDPTRTSSTPAQTSAPTPAASPLPNATQTTRPAVASFTVPSDCRNLVDPGTYSTTFASTPLNDPGVVNPGESGALTPTVPPAGASAEVILQSATQLRCVWRDPGADTTYLEATVATVDPFIAGQYLDTLSTQGYTCKQTNGGRQCQLVTQNPQYPVIDARTAFLRDTAFIFVGQSNFKTNNLIGSITATIWH